MILGLLSEISVFFSSMEEPYLLKLLFYWISFFVLWCFPWQLSMAATDVIRQGQRISVSDTIVSAKGNFELGFFNPGNSHNYYVGIWYKNVAEKTIVWIANRDFPITTASEVLTIHSNGNFVISNQTQVTFTITNTTSKVNTSVILLDSGNLILRDQNSDVLWQSFDFPTHVFLPGMKLGIYNRGRSSWSFVSWKNSEDPGTGEFSLEIDADQPSQILIVKGSQRYWASGFWNGKIFNSIPEMRQNYIYNYIHVSNMDEIYFTYSLFNPYIISHHVMDISGQFKQRVWLHGSQVWKSFWAQPKAQCDVYAICGAFSLCNNRLSKFCQCLRGFEPRSPQDWLRGDKSSGCLRIVKLSCENAAGVNGGDDKFLKVPVSKFPSNGRIFVVSNVEECNLACLSNCSCSAFAYNGSRGCSVWSGDLFSLQQDELMNGETIYLKLSASELPNSGKRRPLLKIIPLVAALALLGFISYITWHWRHKFKRKGKSGSGQDILLFDLGVSAATTKNLSLNKKEVEFGERNNPAMTLFNFASISAATDNFSATNKLGEGGFGPVYEGTILRGQKIAVKRLSKRSAQGLEELKNEAMLIAKLQHRNLVKLLGCCLENEEKILVYEYMPNKSLDSFLFDPAKRSQLDWKTRVRIIEGIAQGLLYLHEYSRLRIIHRDLKASNILLDIDMNPKISDFGMARIFGSNELQANTNRIVGTYGYMPPEYALEGLFSVKSDVYSFGVLLLEILSGKKNTGFYNSDSLNLIGYAWDLWMRNKTLDLMDLELYDESSKHMGLRYVNVALLCVQEIAADRPTMVEVVSMLTNEVVVLSSPKEPAFSIVRSVTTTTNIPEICSVNDVTVSGLEAR